MARQTHSRAAHPTMSKYKLVVAYDGTGYQGWQMQQIGTGVQQIVEEALAKIFRSKPRLHSSSRTDTGVHANGMVAHFELGGDEAPMPPQKLLLAINAHLPADIRIMAASKCRASFHARFDARGKEYRYQVWNHPAMSPLLRHQAWHVPKKLDFALMRQAARQFVGAHDFRSFAASRGYDFGSTVRSLSQCEIKRRGALFTFVICGDGFLYKMCRGIVGTLVQIGLGKFPLDAIPGVLAKKDRRVAGMTAPAHGLVLWRVFYGRGRPSVDRRSSNT